MTLVVALARWRDEQGVSLQVREARRLLALGRVPGAVVEVAGRRAWTIPDDAPPPRRLPRGRPPKSAATA